MFIENMWIVSDEEESIRQSNLDKKQALASLKEDWFSLTLPELVEKYGISRMKIYRLCIACFGIKTTKAAAKRANAARWGQKVLLTPEQAKCLPKDSRIRATKVGVSIHTLTKYNIMI